jgi:cysteine desulfurase family protein (TIGR01976 family)
MTISTHPPSTVESLRRLFPAHDPAAPDAWVRVDGPGGSQTPQPVLDAITDYLRTSNANLGGVFAHSVATDRMVDTTRQRLAAFLGADADEVGFGMNATSVNATLSRAATRGLRPGDEIVVTALDHDANTAPWIQAAADHDLVVRTVGVGADTRLDMAALAEAIGERTRIVAFPWANNVTGTTTDVAAIVGLAHTVGAIAWGDASHFLPHGPVDARATGVDVVIGSAYKFFGPHVGVFHARRELLESWRSDQPGHASPGVAAARLEDGTLPFESLAGLGTALEYLDSIGWEFIIRHENDLGTRFLAGIPEQWRLHGLTHMDGRTATFALTRPGRRPYDLAQALAGHRIAVGAGTFHTTGIINALGLDRDGGAIRIGFLHYNTLDEVDRIVAALATL